LILFLRQVHLELCKVSKIVCSILGVQVAWEIGVIIMYLSGALNNLFIRYVMNQHKVKGVPAETALTLSLSFLNIFRAIFISRICKNVADEVIYLTSIVIFTIIDFIIKLTFIGREIKPLKLFMQFMDTMQILICRRRFVYCYTIILINILY